jgi:hypothetical protein
MPAQFPAKKQCHGLTDRPSAQQEFGLWQRKQDPCEFAAHHIVQCGAVRIAD